MNPPITIWIIVNIFVLAMLILDLLVFHRHAHEVSMKEAAGWSVFWIALSGVFNLGIYFFMGPQAGLEFLTGYLIEKALSVDNLFVFVLIFSYFNVPRKYQHRVLFWGILGAMIMRGVMIALGTALITQFHWIIYLFGAFLVFTGIRMLWQDDEQIEPERNPVLRLFRRIVPVTNTYHAQKFLVKKDDAAGRTHLMATPLLVVLVLIETTDLIFAVDSIPAVFAITLNPFIVYTSNIFAILGLRALYFLLAGVVHKFHYLKMGLSAVLVFVGGKMLLMDIYHISTPLSLVVVAVLIGGSVGASLAFPKPDTLEKTQT
tara:strand:- start:5503 stop:6453 length:951 start_codon:yes stop_codon:yes gene_type:complete